MNSFYHLIISLGRVERIKKSLQETANTRQIGIDFLDCTGLVRG